MMRYVYVFLVQRGEIVIASIPILAYKPVQAKRCRLLEEVERR